MVPWTKKVAYSFNQVGINLLWQTFNTVAVFYYVSDLHVSAIAISVGMIVYGVLNAFLNLLAGYFSDRTNTRYGRRIPYILFGSLPLVVLFYLLFHPFVYGRSALLIYFFVVTLLFDLGFTFVALNIGALYPEMYQNKRDRSNVAALQQLFGIIGMIAGVALSKSVGQTAGFGAMAAIFGIVSLVSLYTSLFGSFENPSYREEPLWFGQAIRETFRNKRFIVYVLASLFIQLTTTMFVTLSSFYSKYVVPLTPIESTLFLGLLFIVAIPLSFVWARVAIRTSAIRATTISTVLYAVFSLGFCFAQNALSVILIGAFLGIPVAGFMVLLNVLLADVIDYDAENTGKRREGMYLGINGFVVRIGMSLQFAIMGAFFVITHFNGGINIQPRGTLTGFRFLMGGAPIVLQCIAFFLLVKYQSYLKKAHFNSLPQGSQSGNI